MQADAIETAVEHGERVLDDFVDIGGLRLGRRKARQGRELVDQAADSFGGAGDGFGAGANYFKRSRVSGSGALQMPANTFRGECDGRERVLDFMSHAASYFTPRGLLLRLEQVGEVFEDDYVARLLALMAECGNRNGYVQGSALGGHFHL